MLSQISFGQRSGSFMSNYVATITVSLSQLVINCIKVELYTSLTFKPFTSLSYTWNQITKTGQRNDNSHKFSYTLVILSLDDFWTFNILDTSWYDPIISCHIFLLPRISSSIIIVFFSSSLYRSNNIAREGIECWSGISILCVTK